VALHLRPPQWGGGLGEGIRSARTGSAGALGRLLEECRPSPLLVANQELPPGLRGEAGASDLVQDTFLQAQHHFDRFHDDGEAEWAAWLRGILLHSPANLRQRYCGTDRRQRAGCRRPTARRGSIADVPAPDPSPSALAAAREQDAALRRAPARLPWECRRVVTWRGDDRLPFDEIGRSARAARKLWVRAVEHLRQGLDHTDEA
jgi:DNA-directed RNA polymerase specialized sigma24 family protein